MAHIELKALVNTDQLSEEITETLRSLARSEVRSLIAQEVNAEVTRIGKTIETRLDQQASRYLTSNTVSEALKKQFAAFVKEEYADAKKTAVISLEAFLHTPEFEQLVIKHIASVVANIFRQGMGGKE